MARVPVRWSRWLITTGIATLAIVALALALRAFWTGRRDAMAVKQMCSVASALRVYETTHGKLPPAYVTGEDGRPAHSWRILLLPLLGYEDVFRKYDFTEPWNGPHNHRLLSEIPVQYQSANGPEGYTDIVAIVGKTTAWPGPDGLSLEDVNVSTLVILVRAAEPREWLAPNDLSYSAMVESLRSAEGLSTLLEKEAYCVTADGVVHRLRFDMTAAELHHVLSVEDKARAPLTRDVLIW